MKKELNKTGVTLVEILVVVAIIAILVTMVIGIAARIDTQGKEQLTQNTIALLTAALGQFHDYGFTYSAPFDVNFNFPLDCNGFSTTNIRDELQTALGLNPGDVTISVLGTYDPCYSGCEVMYFFLNRVPESRETLNRIDKSFITRKDASGQDMTITVRGQSYPLFRVIDPWGKPLRYDYYDEKPPPHNQTDIDNMNSSRKTFPVVTSAGPDGIFDTDDDIKNR